MHYVKPDGTEEVTVQWYPNFYANYSIENYVQSLRDIWPSADDFNLSAEPMTRIAGLAVGGPEPAEEIGYRTADGSSTDNEASRNAHRTTYADMLPSNDDLWVVSVTVVTDTEGSGSTLFGKIKSTFKPTS